MSSTFFIPAVNIMGIDCLDEAMTAIRNYGFGKALIVTDVGLAKAGVAGMIAEKLAMQDIDSVIYDGAKPNPSVENVEKAWRCCNRAPAISSCPWAAVRPMTAPRASPCALPTAGASATMKASTNRASHNCRWWPSIPPLVRPAR